MVVMPISLVLSWVLLPVSSAGSSSSGGGGSSSRFVIPVKGRCTL